MKFILTSMKNTSVFVCIMFISSLLFFLVIEIFPELLDQINLNNIRYYAQKRGNIVDDELVYRPRSANFTIDRVFNGDLFDIDPVLAAFVEPMAIKYTATYEDGFRANSSKEPYDMLVLGDSFIEIGENDSATFSEKLAEVSGLATFNLGRAGYGPYQYKILLNDYLKLRPRYAVVSFFAGNDMIDVKNYEAFLLGSDYGNYLGRNDFVERYLIAISDTYLALLKAFNQLVIPNMRTFYSKAKSMIVRDNRVKKGPSRLRDYIGAIRLNGESVAMRFSHWNQAQSAEELIRKREWRSLKSILSDIKNITEQQDIQLIILYIPSKIQVYGQYYVANESGSGFLKRIEGQLKYERNTLDAFSNVTRALGLQFLDLHGYFKGLAKEGELLFYPFDTHWNVNGREMAAKFVASYIESTPPK